MFLHDKSVLKHIILPVVRVLWCPNFDVPSGLAMTPLPSTRIGAGTGPTFDAMCSSSDTGLTTGFTPVTLVLLVDSVSATVAIGVGSLEDQSTLARLFREDSFG